MIRHIVSWNFQPQLSQEEKEVTGAAIVAQVSRLATIIPGTIKAEMVCPPLDTSSGEIALYSEFESREALAAYQVHPEHVEVANLIKNNCCDRCCVDVLG